MSMKSGASDSEKAFSNSLAEAIENAFKMEWLTAKGETLTDDGSEDRRLLFAAFAQGILNYLKDHDDDLKFSMQSGFPAIFIQSPHLDVQPKEGSSQITAMGQFFPSDKQITLIWDEPLQTYDSETNEEGHFGRDFEPPAEAASGKHIVEARDEAGHVAFAVFMKP